MPIDGVAAARKLQGFDISNRTGACLYWVWGAYDAVGADTTMSAYYALDAFGMSLGHHPASDREPPAGALVAFGVRKSDGDRAGDVAISLGGGRIVATDQPTWGKVGITTIAGREKLTGRPYLGWADHIFDVPISLPSTASTGDAPATNKGIEFDMSTATTIYKEFIDQTVGASHWLYLNKDHDVSVAGGETLLLAGTLYLQIATTKQSKGCYQIQPVISTFKDGKNIGKDVSLGVHEVIPTTGKTLSQVPVPPVKLKSGERLRFRIAGTDGLTGKLVKGIYRGAQVKS
ncbi:hypothetical protein [Microbacterium sp. KR10-403]|uniref:hypothetical protein n=1 Tax=Microbacterium sp. KR10-403 TaxID=3158581 RepID=UPI0032E3859A